MSTTFKSQMSEIMRLAWQIVKRNGYTMSEALKVSWMQLKLKARMKKGIIRFFYYKVDGSVRSIRYAQRIFDARNKGYRSQGK